MTARSAVRRCGCMLLALAAVALASCEAETRIVSVRGLGSNLPGAKGGLKPDGAPPAPKESNAGAAGRGALLPGLDAEGRPTNPLRREGEDGAITLISNTPRHVIAHVRQTLAAQEHDLLLEQVLSERTKREYRRVGRDPREAVDFLVRNRAEVMRLFGQMPMGEMSPGLYMKPVGSGVYRLEVPERMDGGKFTKLDVIWERGVCRLVLIS